MKTYIKLPAIIGVLGASALATNLAIAVPEPPAEKLQAVESYGDTGLGNETSDGRHLKSAGK